MADIDIVPKSRSRVWLWVVLAIAVIALLIWFVSGRRTVAGTASIDLEHSPWHLASGASLTVV